MYINLCIYLQDYHVAFVYWRLNHPIEQTQQKSTVWVVIFNRRHH